MPNPKTGTVTLDVKKAVMDAKAGKVEFRADKQGMVHVPIGKMSFTSEALADNFYNLAEAVIKAKPSAAKGTYLKSVYWQQTRGRHSNDAQKFRLVKLKESSKVKCFRSLIN
jgi:large subunit ribosomal protein L1